MNIKAIIESQVSEKEIVNGRWVVRSKQCAGCGYPLGGLCGHCKYLTDQYNIYCPASLTYKGVPIEFDGPA